MRADLFRFFEFGTFVFLGVFHVVETLFPVSMKVLGSEVEEV
jgi:hypothetical protein